jgi:hypothetical protein
MTCFLVSLHAHHIAFFFIIVSHFLTACVFRRYALSCSLVVFSTQCSEYLEARFKILEGLYLYVWKRTSRSSVGLRDGVRGRACRVVSGLFGFFLLVFVFPFLPFNLFRLLSFFRCGLAHVPVMTVAFLCSITVS